MKVKKWRAVVWMLLTILPLIYFPLSMVMFTTSMWREPSDSFDKQFDTFFEYGLVLNGLILFLTASYLIYLFATPYVHREKRMLWVVSLLFLNLIAMPFFWYWYVWGPLRNPPRSDTEPVARQSKLVPMLIGVAMLSIIPAVTIVGAYSEGHAYSDIADRFPPTDDDEYVTIPAGRVSISKQNRATRTVSVGDVLDVAVSDTSVRFKPSTVMGVLYRSFEIPAIAVHSCSKQCGGITDYMLLLDTGDTQIAIEEAPAMLEWCWSNKLPILASSQRREWLYNGVPLPDRSALDRALSDRSGYDHAAKQACLGY